MYVQPPWEVDIHVKRTQTQPFASAKIMAFVDLVQMTLFAPVFNTKWQKCSLEGPRVSHSHPSLEAGFPCQGDQVSCGSAEGLLGWRVSAPQAASSMLHCLPCAPSSLLPSQEAASISSRSEKWRLFCEVAPSQASSCECYIRTSTFFLEFDSGLLGIISQREL